MELVKHYEKWVYMPTIKRVEELEILMESRRLSKEIIYISKKTI